jgi:hypothetical protein
MTPSRILSSILRTLSGFETIGIQFFNLPGEHRPRQLRKTHHPNREGAKNKQNISGRFTVSRTPSIVGPLLVYFRIHESTKEAFRNHLPRHSRTPTQLPESLEERQCGCKQDIDVAASRVESRMWSVVNYRGYQPIPHGKLRSNV